MKKLGAEEIVRQLAAIKLSSETYLGGCDLLVDELIKQGREWVADNPPAREQVVGQYQRHTQPCRNPEPCPPNVNFRHLFCKNCGVLLSSHAEDRA